MNLTLSFYLHKYIITMIVASPVTKHCISRKNYSRLPLLPLTFKCAILKLIRDYWSRCY